MRIDGAGWYPLGLLAVLSVIGAGSQPPADTLSEHTSPRLIVADFDQPGFQNNLGLPFGAWERDPQDATQFCHVRLVESPRVGPSGSSLQLEYDVDSPNPAYNGLWMKLPSVPVRSVRALRFAIRGDARRAFTRRLKVELKDARHAAVFVLDGIRADWIRMRIPLNAFRDIEQIDALTEFVLVFDDRTVTRPTGILYLDDVMLELVS